MQAGRIVLGGTNTLKLAKQVAKILHCTYKPIVHNHFPDGESYLRLPEVKGKAVVIILGMYPNPNEEALEAMFAIHTARDLGARHVTLVAPYLAYMRQDKRFNPGECVSAHVLPTLLQADRLLAIDPHLHRIRHLKNLFRGNAQELTANNVLASYLQKNHPNAVLCGPDEESSQWAAAIAKSICLDSLILKKHRYGPNKVKVKVKIDHVARGRDVVIVDDMISTGHTTAEAAGLLFRLGAKSVSAICVHGLFVGNAVQILKKAGIRNIVCTNTIESKYSKINIAKLIAGNL